VNDFRSVDYEAIAMLNVSASQELNRRLEQQQNHGQAQQIETQKRRIEARERRLTELLTTLSAVTGQIPRGHHG
jgi:hypothetical protein